jgi:hypothetical protein
MVAMETPKEVRFVWVAVRSAERPQQVLGFLRVPASALDAAHRAEIRLLCSESLEDVGTSSDSKTVAHNFQIHIAVLDLWNDVTEHAWEAEFAIKSSQDVNYWRKVHGFVERL